MIDEMKLQAFQRQVHAAGSAILECSQLIEKVLTFAEDDAVPLDLGALKKANASKLEDKFRHAKSLVRSLGDTWPF